jgi:hypothetical protein
MNADEQILGKVVVNLTRRYLAIYRCDGNGKVEEWEQFKYAAKRTKQAEVRADTADVFDLLYDYANDWINGDLQGEEGEQRECGEGDKS